LTPPMCLQIAVWMPWHGPVDREQIDIRPGD
jgi:hypothetical protein